MKEKIQYSQSGLTIESAENIQGAFVCPEKIIHIQDFAFSECEELTQLILSPNLSGIGQFAIANCSNLSVVVFPKNINYEALEISSNAFDGCQKLSVIIVDDDDPSVLDKVRSLLPTELQNKVFLEKDLKNLAKWQLNAQEALTGLLKNKEVANLIAHKGLELHFFKPAPKPQDTDTLNENQQTKTNKKPG